MQERIFAYHLPVPLSFSSSPSSASAELLVADTRLVPAQRLVGRVNLAAHGALVPMQVVLAAGLIRCRRCRARPPGVGRAIVAEAAQEKHEVGREVLLLGLVVICRRWLPERHGEADRSFVERWALGRVVFLCTERAWRG
jgi:hypothetical protein